MEGFFKLDSFIVEKIWGSFKLNQFKKLDNEGKIGETYEVSSHPSGNSMINGQKLSHFLDLNYLIKFIDTSDHLSIQVHPGDDYAKVNENDSGKTECWIIQDCEDDAGIYLGFKPSVTRKEFKTALGSSMAIDKFLNFIPVKKGQFFIIPSGLIHAID